MNPTVEKYARHVNPAFVRLLGVYGYGRVFVRARDVWLWDDQDRRYLDALAGFGAVNLGHNHPRLLERLRGFLSGESLNLNHVGPSSPAADLAEALAALTDGALDIALFSSGGAEGVEAALKLARAATGRSRFVSAEGGFHGTSFGTLSVMGADRMRNPFEPLLADGVRVPFGDLAALDTALDRRTAAFIVEPIQSEGGIVLPPPEYLHRARDLCRERGALFVLDEIQTGLGRTGAMLASVAEGVVPDVLVLGKSLGGSIVPISPTLTTREIHDRAYGGMDRFDLHSSTFGGNAFACTAGLETLRLLAEERLVERSATLGTHLLQGLRARLEGHPLVREVRGRGLLVGIDLGPAKPGWFDGVKDLVSRAVFGQWAALRLLERGVLCQPAALRWNVLRIEPPLTIDEAGVNLIIEAVAGVLQEHQGFAPILKGVIGRLGQQFSNGWTFR